MEIHERLPCVIEDEKLVLGAFLAENQGDFADLRALLRSEDFDMQQHRTIFGAMLAVQDRGEEIDHVTVAREIQTRGGPKGGDIGYLLDLREMMPRIVNLEYYARKIREASDRRRIIFTLDAAIKETWQITEDPCEILSSLVERLGKIGKPSKQTLKTAGEVIADCGGLDAMFSEKDGLLTPWARMNEFTGGLKPKELTIIAGLTASGKSAMLHQIGEYAAEHCGAVVAMFSLEMSAKQVVARLIAGRAGIGSHQARRDTSPEGRQRIVQAAREVDALDVKIEDSSANTLAAIRGIVRTIPRDGRPLLLVIDYLQIISTSGRFDNRAQAVAELSRGLKLMAGEFDCSVLAASQLRRGTQDREPTLEDLKESSGIEQDADRVILLRRKTKTYTPNEPIATQALIAKQRNGPSGCYLDLFFIPRLTRFFEEESGLARSSQGSLIAARMDRG